MFYVPLNARSICMLVILRLVVSVANVDENRPTALHQKHRAHDHKHHQHESKYVVHGEHRHGSHSGQRHEIQHHQTARSKHVHGDHHHGPDSPKHAHHETQTQHHKKHSASHTNKGADLTSKQSKHHTLKESCEKLINHGTHFTVELEVGTPPQIFGVVADTGSDAILIPSCQCVEDAYCSNESRCFTGTNTSSTFSYKKNKKGNPLNSIKMMFGSGPVEAVVASDTVRVGNVKVMMKDAVLLMTDHMLNIKGPFEGILGLGLPASHMKSGLYRRSTDSESGSLKSAGSDCGGSHRAAKYAQSAHRPVDSHHQRHGKDSSAGDGPTVDYSPMMNVALPHKVAVEVEPSASLLQVTKPLQKKVHLAHGTQEDSWSGSKKMSKGKNSAKGNNSAGIVVKGFAESAGIDRFSMCFNDGAPGVLRLQSEKVKLSHGSVGQVHWGLDFRGIGIGNTEVPVKICQEMSKKGNQTTPCGAIPDSGTTALMGPKEHILALYESICDGWDRCKKNHTAYMKARKDAHEAAVRDYNVDPFELANATKGMIFQMLLMDCHTWWENRTGLDELPDLNFYVRGVNGTEQTLLLHGWSYVIETFEKDFTTIYKEIEGVGTMPVGRNFTGGSHKVCSPAFSTMDYQTEKNGPVWILGTPIFYEYQVGYDYKAQPPAISFDDTECGTCEKQSLMAVDSKRVRPSEGLLAHSSTRSRGRRPRQVLGKFRMPSIDTSLPL
mmetsp:Transcript_29178/g.51018  ORF Transcript_29178/g.51018 Transcript_29178/m.51018 type:complete len:722 (-) Transcript_29178:128-2293(-)